MKPQRPADASAMGALLADVLSFGWSLPASIAAGAGMGWLVDRFAGTFPWFTFGLGGLGAVGGLWQLSKEAARLAEPKEPKKEPKEQQDTQASEPPKPLDSDPPA